MLLLTFDSEMAAINLIVKLKQFADFLCSAVPALSQANGAWPHVV